MLALDISMVTLDATIQLHLLLRYLRFLRKDISQGLYIQLHWVFVIKTTGGCVNMEEISSCELFLRLLSENELQTTKRCLTKLRPSNENQVDRIVCHSKPAVTVSLPPSICTHICKYTPMCVYKCIQ